MTDFYVQGVPKSLSPNRFLSSHVKTCE